MLSTLTAALLIGLMPLALATAADDPQKPFDLKTFQGESRPLILFAPSEDDPRAAEQRRGLGDSKAAFSDRQMVFVEVYGASGGRQGDRKLSAVDAKALRDRFRVDADEFTLILVGKDGGEKMRLLRPIPIGEVYETIDAMPMRQREIRERRDDG